MHFRIAENNDVEALIELYREVAKSQSGITRLEQEITEDYVNDIVDKTLTNGLIIVGVHPEDSTKLISAIHGHRSGLKFTNHVLSNLTLIVHPVFQGRKVGRTMLTIFLEEIGKNQTDIGKVSLMVRETNTKAILLYQSLGFVIEGRFEMAIKTPDLHYEASIPMSWQNPNFEFD